MVKHLVFHVLIWSDHVQRTWTWINLQCYAKVSCYSMSRNNKSMVFEPSYTMVATFMSRNSGLDLAYKQSIMFMFGNMMDTK